MDCCCCFTQKRPTCKPRKPNYQKLVDPYVQLSAPQVPLISSLPTIEYRVTSDARHKDANHPGVQYLQNFTTLDYSDRMWWIQNRLCRQEAWIGDGSYSERRPQNLHHFGATSFDLRPTQCIPFSRPTFETKYVNFLEKKEPHVPCTMGAVDRRGVKFTIPYPCDKYLPKETWDNSSCKKRPANCQQRGTEYNICVPKEPCCPNKFICEQKTCPPPGCQKYLSCKPDCEKPKLICEQKTCPPSGCQKYLSCKPDCEKPKLICKQKTSPCCEKTFKCQRAEPEGCDEGKKLIISVPDGDHCTRDIPLGNVRVYLPPEKPPKPRFHQKDYTYRCESRELLGSKLLTYCLCVRRNGLQDDCPRTPCRGRPACITKPWPNCWPSGGCHGQDYDRVNGIERVNPTLQYRRDNPKCGPCYPPSPDVRLIVEQC